MTDADEGEAEATPDGAPRRSAPFRRKRTWEIVLLVALLGVLGLAAWRRWAPPAYVGTSRRVTLTWSCTNGIQWPAATTGAFWWAGHDPVGHGKVMTATLGEDSAGIPIHRATGKVHFDSRDRATFRSDAGGTLALQRVAPGTFLTADCAFGGPLGSD